MTDQFPDWVASLDQIAAGFKDLAAVLWSHYENMLEVGFSPEQALNLTIAFQTAGMHLGDESE